MNFFERAGELEVAGTPFVVVTMTATRGHAPQDPGAKAIVTSTGLDYGTVGGGKVEAKAIVYAQEFLNDSNPERPPTEVLTWNLQKDVGMSCGGEVQFLFERFVPLSWKIVIFGAGHVSQALTRSLLGLDCQVTCIDTRPEWLEKLPSSPKLTIRHVEDLAQAATALSDRAFVVVMTRGHATDLPVLEALLKRPGEMLPYVGVIGSDVKAIRIRRDLAKLGVTPERIEKLHCPMGVEIDNRNHPGEIAISIAAGLIQARGRAFVR